MRQKKFVLGFALIAIVMASHSLSFAQSNSKNESWGDLGYAHPQPDVEVVPDVVPTEPSEEVAMNPSNDLRTEPQSSAEAAAPEAEKAPDTVTIVRSSSEASISEKDLSQASTSGSSNVNTVENTYGVMTEEKPKLQIFAAPYAGIASSFGNDTVSTNPNYAAGATLGLLISSNMMLQASFNHTEQGAGLPNQPNSLSVYSLKSNEIDGGARLFFLGRESKFRPFFGAGMGYSRMTLNYNAAVMMNQTMNDYTVGQFKGFGELGLEFAFTRMFVAMASFKVDGVLSSNTDSVAGFDQNAQIAGSSLSRSASYTIGAGVGIYF